MDITLKQRLLGGALLVAVAVVFLPMMFDGSAREKPTALDMDIPPKPEYSFAPAPGSAKEKQAGMTPAAPKAKAGAEQRIALAESPAQRSEKQLPAADSARAEAPAKAKLAPAGKQEAVRAPADRAAPDQAAVAVIEPAAEAPSAVTEPAPKTPPPAVKKSAATAGKKSSPQASAWAVQVGSFSERGNAQSLQKQLRSSGFAAFEEKVQSGGEQVFRVKVGPELDRARAEALRGKLQAQEDLRGIVVSHPLDAAPIVLRGGG